MATRSGGKNRTSAQAGWVLRRDLEVDVLMSRRAVGEAFEAAQRRLTSLCACCQRSFQPERLLRAVCVTCREHTKCAKCEQPFQVGKDSFGRVCDACWSELSSDSSLAARLEQSSRDAVTKELHRLAFGRVSACAAATEPSVAATKPNSKALTSAERARKFELARAAMK